LITPEVKQDIDDLKTVISASVGSPINAIRRYTVYDDGGVEGVYRLGQELFNFTIADGQFSSEPAPQEKTDANPYPNISFAVPLAVQKAAKKGLELRRKHGRGGLTLQEAGEQGIGSGIARARDLAAGKVSPDTVRRMKAYFQRHAKDKQGKDWDNPTKPSNGRIAWELWGGESGKAWAERIVRQMDIADRRAK